MLSKEVSEVGSYFSILKAIASGSRKSGEIAAALNVRQTNLAKYLKVLKRLDVVAREVPVTELNPEKSKKGLYRIKDNYLRFWFKFLFPNMGMLETGRSGEVSKMIKRNFIDGQVSYVYEEVCRDRIWDLGVSDMLPFVPERAGAWWGHKDVELDVVALSVEKGRAIFGECKFWNKPIGKNVLEHLREQAAKALADASFEPYRDRPIYVLFGISGFTEDLVESARQNDDVFLFE